MDHPNRLRKQVWKFGWVSGVSLTCDQIYPTTDIIDQAIILTLTGYIHTSYWPRLNQQKLKAHKPKYITQCTDLYMYTSGFRGRKRNNLLS